MEVKTRVFTRKKKECRFCRENIPLTSLNYKEKERILRDFISERAKILSRRITGTCARHQRQLKREIKKARILALLPFTTLGKTYIEE